MQYLCMTVPLWFLHCKLFLFFERLHAALLDVVAHEAQRTFRDRLIDSESENKFDGMVSGLLQRHWKHVLNLDGFVYTALGIAGGSHGRKVSAAGESKAPESGAGAGDQGLGDGLQVQFGFASMQIELLAVL